MFLASRISVRQGAGYLDVLSLLQASDKYLNFPATQYYRNYAAKKILPDNESEGFV